MLCRKVFIRFALRAKLPKESQQTIFDTTYVILGGKHSGHSYIATSDAYQENQNPRLQ